GPGQTYERNRFLESCRSSRTAGQGIPGEHRLCRSTTTGGMEGAAPPTRGTYPIRRASDAIFEIAEQFIDYIKGHTPVEESLNHPDSVHLFTILLGNSEGPAHSTKPEIGSI